jgi:Pyruvate/2-oxoacid:ferredoxin oxidoreductase delta subunit
MDDNTRDVFVEDRLAKYDKWYREGKIPFSSKVIPVRESVEGKQWVMPTEQVLEFLRNARSFAVTHCVCRSHYKRCDNPTEICFLINDAADAEVTQSTARQLSLEEAEKLLHQADERGLVHLTVYNATQHPYAICSCCSCCCHDLQFLQKHGRADLVVRSEYVAQTNMDACTHCGDCIERCVFDARVWEGDRMHYDPVACYGCGLCVTVCPAQATVMVRRSKR